MDSKAYRDWQAEGSGNVAADGMFSIQVLHMHGILMSRIPRQSGPGRNPSHTVQVLGKALEHWNLSCTNLDSPEATESKAHPEDEQAFICNLQAFSPPPWLVPYITQAFTSKFSRSKQIP